MFRFEKVRGGVFLVTIFVLIVGSIIVATKLNAYGAITGTNYAKIRIGEKLSEVEKILGKSQEGLAPLNHQDLHADESGLMVSPPWDLHFWMDGSYMITVMVDSRGRVATKSYSRSPDVGIFRRIVDWAGL